MIIIIYVIAILCMVFVGFHIMDFLSWYWVKSKSMVVRIYNWLREISK